MAKSGFLAEAKARGFVFQCTDEAALDEACANGRIAGYAGFDLTADSLHVGHMIPIMLLRLFQKHGHRPVALMGGGTTRIGDPSFREEARQLLGDAQIAANLVGIRRNIEAFISFGDGPNDAVLVNNADWLDKLGYIELLREVGVHFSVNRMLSFDSVRNRLEREQGLTFLEFNYSILQSYDFRELNRRHGVTLQMGGSDQWGNIAAGAVWLSAEKLSPYHYWQFWRNAEDADVGRFMRLFTDLPLEEIARLEALGGAEINAAKVILATEATALAHGRAAADAAAETARRIFAEGGAADGLPSVEVPAAEFGTGMPAFALFVRAGLAASNGEARRLIRGGGARLNDLVIADEALIVEPAGQMKLSAGKKQHVLVKVAR